MPRFRSHDGTEFSTRPPPGGTPLAYHEKGAGPPLVCVPGGPARASAYLGDLGGLSAHRRLILLDNRGTGDSATPADPDTYRCDRLIDDVEALRAHLGLEKIDLLGHSAAGNIVILYAARHPERISHLVLVAPGWRATALEFTDEEWLTAIHRRSQESWYDTAYAALMRWNQDGEDTAENRRAASPFFFGPWTPAAQEFTDTLHAQHFPEATAGFRVDGAFGDPADTHKALADLAAPVLLLGGDLDPAPTPRLLTDYAALFANATLIIQPESGHSPWIDDPGEFVTTVNRFLSARVASRQ